MPAGLKNAWSKMRAYLIRLSLIMAVCRVADSAGGGFEEITVADVENAAVLVEYFKGMARKAHGQINSFDTSSKVAYELISLLRENGEIKATADELRQMLPSAPDTAEATSKLIERISKEHDFIEFGRGWRHDSRVITLRLTEKTVGTVGTVGDPSDCPDILERKSEFASVPIAYRLSEPDEAYCDNCAQHTEQDITARPLRFTPEDRIWFASEVCRACGHEHPGLYDDGYVLYPEEVWGWYAIALEPMPTT
jgi:hypothetical protein